MPHAPCFHTQGRTQVCQWTAGGVGRAPSETMAPHHKGAEVAYGGALFYLMIVGCSEYHSWPDHAGAGRISTTQKMFGGTCLNRASSKTLIHAADVAEARIHMRLSDHGRIGAPRGGAALRTQPNTTVFKGEARFIGDKTRWSASPHPGDRGREPSRPSRLEQVVYHTTVMMLRMAIGGRRFAPKGPLFSWGRCITPRLRPTGSCHEKTRRWWSVIREYARRFTMFLHRGPERQQADTITLDSRWPGRLQVTCDVAAGRRPPPGTPTQGGHCCH